MILISRQVFLKYPDYFKTTYSKIDMTVGEAPQFLLMNAGFSNQAEPRHKKQLASNLGHTGFRKKFELFLKNVELFPLMTFDDLGHLN